MTNITSTLRCGLAGWHYSHWNRTVYPSPRPRGFHELSYLSGFFDAIEINSSFYQSIRPEIAHLWLRQVEQNPTFEFTVKLHHSFTHLRQLEAGEVASLREGLKPLAESGRLGCVLMQFPWSFRFTAENRDYFVELRRALHGYRLVAEMRHASWMHEEALGVFIDHHVGFVNIDQPPHTKAMPPTAFLTSPVGYVRLHGRNGANWFRQFGDTSEAERRHNYLYTPVELTEWQRRIDRVSRFASSTYVIFNNDGGGKAVVNALQMRSMLEGTKLVAPQLLHRRYGWELQGYVERPLQPSLFAPVTRAVA